MSFKVRAINDLSNIYLILLSNTSIKCYIYEILLNSSVLQSLVFRKAIHFNETDSGKLSGLKCQSLLNSFMFSFIVSSQQSLLDC